MQMDLLGNMKFNSMVCDQAHNDIWALAGFYSADVYRYSLDSGLWQTMPSLPAKRGYTQSVLCKNSQVLVTPGGVISIDETSSILLTSTVTGKTKQSHITLPRTVAKHVSACVSH